MCAVPQQMLYGPKVPLKGRRASDRVISGHIRFGAGWGVSVMIEELALNSTTAIVRLLAMLAVATMAHELGHVFAARLFRIPVLRIAIGLGPVIWHRSLPAGREFVLRAFPVGVMIGLPGRQGTFPERPPWCDLLIAAGGPIINLLLFVALAVLDGLGLIADPLLPWVRTLALISVFLGISNLLPVPGLDGGHIVMLAAVKLGLRTSSRGQAAVQKTGLRLTAAVCAGVVVARLLQLI